MKRLPHILFSAILATANIGFSAPVNFTAALESRRIRSILPTTLSSAELAQISEDILERATFSARVSYATILDEIDDLLNQILRGQLDDATARLRLQEKLAEIGYLPAPGEFGKITDIASDQRTNLIIRMNAEMAHGYGTWMQGQSTAVLDQWPAQELYRAYHRKIPRNWIARWQQAGGRRFDGKMIALKNTAIWTAISRFGTPYPPFDFNSGMAVRDVSRKTAVSLGLIDRDTRIEPQTRGFNDDLQFDSSIRSAALRQALEELGYRFEGDVLTL